MRKPSILFIYASTGGNTEMVVTRVADLLRSQGFEVVVQRAERSRPEDLEGDSVCVLGSGTYGHGLLEYNMERFAHALREHPNRFKNRAFAVIGLGDDKYDSYYNMESAKILETLVQEHGGHLIVESLRLNKSPIPHLTGRVTEWTDRLVGALKSP